MVTVSVLLALIGLICGILALGKFREPMPWTALGVIFVALALIVPGLAR